MAIVTPYVDNHIKIISISHFTDGRLAWAAGMNGNYVDNIVTLSSFAKSILLESLIYVQKIKSLWYIIICLQLKIWMFKRRRVLRS